MPDDFEVIDGGRDDDDEPVSKRIENELRATISTSDGQEADVTPLIRGQQGLDVGPAAKSRFTDLVVGKTPLPVFNAMSVSGSFRPTRDVEQGERLLVQVSDADGEIIGTAYCEVNVGFKKQVTRDMAFIERSHKAVVEK